MCLVIIRFCSVLPFLDNYNGTPTRGKRRNSKWAVREEYFFYTGPITIFRKARSIFYYIYFLNCSSSALTRDQDWGYLHSRIYKRSESLLSEMENPVTRSIRLCEHLGEKRRSEILGKQSWRVIESNRIRGKG